MLVWSIEGIDRKCALLKRDAVFEAEVTWADWQTGKQLSDGGASFRVAASGAVTQRASKVHPLYLRTLHQAAYHPTGPPTNSAGLLELGRVRYQIYSPNRDSHRSAVRLQRLP